MSTATKESVELDVNLDEAVPCMSKLSDDGCERPAAWRATTSCNHTATVCEVCKPELQARQEFAFSLYGRLSCSFGGEKHIVYSVNWRPL